MPSYGPGECPKPWCRNHPDQRVVKPGREDYSNISSTGEHDQDDPATGRCSHEATSGSLPRAFNCFTQSSTTGDDEARERDRAAREERRERDKEARKTAKQAREEKRAKKALNRARKEEEGERREDEQDEWEHTGHQHSDSHPEDRIVDGRHQVFANITRGPNARQPLGNREMPATRNPSSVTSARPQLGVHGLLQNLNPFDPEKRESHELAKVVFKRKRNLY